MRELQRDISSREFAELQVYYSMYPHWTVKLEFYLAQLAYEVFRGAHDLKPGSDISLHDFILEFGGRADKPQTEEQIRNVLNLYCGE